MALKYIIEGKKWFDKANGNTYHSVLIIDAETRKPIAVQGMTYGYGDQWRHTAYDLLVKKGLAKKEDENNHDLNRDRFYYSDLGEGRQRDLHEEKDYTIDEPKKYLSQNQNKKLKVGSVVSLETGQDYELIGKEKVTRGGEEVFVRKWKPVNNKRIVKRKRKTKGSSQASWG